MTNLECYPQSDPNVLYPYCPSYGAAILFAVLFGLVTTIHLVQAIVLRKSFAWVLIMGGVWETLGYIFRSLSVEKQENMGYFMAQLLLVLLAPLWINAFVYMVLGRMVHFYLDDDKVFGIRARRLGLIFVLLDITAFIVQLAGGAMTSSSNPINVQEDGFHTYMGGIGLQQFFICVFFGLAIRFHYKTRKQASLGLSSANEIVEKTDLRSPLHARRMVILVYTVLTLITVRIIFRLVEFSGGVNSDVVKHEWYSSVFDALMMLCALVAFNVFHPARILRGPNSDFAEDKKREKETKRAKRVAKEEAKEAKKTAKEANKMLQNPSV